MSAPFRPATLAPLALLAALAGTALPAAPAAAQGGVTGQVALLERPGERTEDLGDAVVWLEATGARARSAPRTATIQLQGRKFAPRVRVVTAGSRLDFPNQDSFSHNVFSKAPGGAFDTGLYGRGRSREQTFREPGVYPLYCNIHPKMTGYVVVVPSPWLAQAGEDGRFEIAAVPPGTYTMHVWHARAPATARAVSVSAAGLAAGRTELDARGYRFVQHKDKTGKEYTTPLGDRY